MVWLFRFACMFCFGLAGFAVYLITTDRRPKSLAIEVVLILLFGSAATYCWDAQRRALNQIVVDESGIWRLAPRGKTLFIAWHNVGDVKADDTMQRLIVSGRSHAERIWLEYQLDNYSTLRDYVLRHATSRTLDNADRNAVFHFVWVLKAIMAICAAPFIFVVVIGSIQGAWQQAVFALAFVLLELVVVVNDPVTLALHPDRFVIRYPGWKREFLFRDVVSVTQNQIADAKGNVSYPVMIVMKNGKPMQLRRFREGSLAVFEALSQALGSTSPANLKR